MKVDVEIELPSPSSFRDCRLDEVLPAEYFVEERGTRKKAFFLRSPASIGNTIDETIGSFLFGLRSLEEKFKTLNAELRVGVFYDLRETIIFPFFLTKQTITRIASFDLSLDSVIYVCSEEE